MPGKKLRFADIIIIAICLAVSAVLFIFVLFRGRDGKLYLNLVTESGSESISLTKDAELKRVSNGIEVVIAIEDGTVFFKTSECPNGICVRSKPISRTGESIICAPAALAAIIESEGGEADADAVAW